MDHLSIVLPACNEARRLPQLLDALVNEKKSRLEIIVVANGCSDDSADIARGFYALARSNGHVLKVLETGIASKAAALNLGEKETNIFPRIFMDADILPSAGALRAVSIALNSNPGRLVAPQVKFQSGGGPISKLVAPFLSELPPFYGDVVGAGFYATDRMGRGRWEHFPDLFADDAFVCGLFSIKERLQLSDCFFEARFPSDEDLFGVILRWNLGRIQLKQAGYAIAGKRSRKIFDFGKPVMRHPMAAFAWFWLAVTAKAAARFQMLLRIQTKWHRALER